MQLLRVDTKTVCLVKQDDLLDTFMLPRRNFELYSVN